MTLDEVMEAETFTMGRPCRRITQHCAYYRDPNDVEHETWLVIYDASSASQPQTRWAVYNDGKPGASGIVQAGGA